MLNFVDFYCSFNFKNGFGDFFAIWISYNTTPLNLHFKNLLKVPWTIFPLQVTHYTDKFPYFLKNDADNKTHFRGVPFISRHWTKE